MMMKKLCRIRLINWHYFVNETISISGSTLISGENTAGKSTILDAIQLVLTTNSRRFNTAANEKSSRDLKGYVRCKTGNENNTYVRKGGVITYVALEFYEEKTSRYFTLGVKIDSPDEESKLSTKWFREECKLEELSFLNGGRPSTTEEFRRSDKKIALISQITEAKARFSQRLGYLEDRFFDMIPKSLAFKPMDNVKDFINKFILSEKTIEVETLRNNIEVLKELEDLMETTKEKISALKIILLKNEEITAKEREIKTNEILIKKAELEAKKLEHKELLTNNHIFKQNLLIEQKNEETLKISLENEQSRYTNLQIAMNQNETSRLIVSTRHNIEIYQIGKQAAKEKLERLQQMQKTVIVALSTLNKYSINILSKDEVLKISNANIESNEKMHIVLSLKKELEILLETYNSYYVRTKDLLDQYKFTKLEIETEINNLKNKKLTYPDNCIKLKTAIEKEFLGLGIYSEVRIFSDLLEITDAKWQNAVEGYLNSQRFYIIVEPQHYPSALKVYYKIKKEVHTVGLVNTSKLNFSELTDTNSLSYIVKSDNRFAKAYAIYLLNRVIRCDNVDGLKDHKIAITQDCMIYQNYAVRKIAESVYNTPFIGAFAYEIQLKNKQNQLKNLNEEINATSNKMSVSKQIIDAINSCKIDVLEANCNAPLEFQKHEQLILTEQQELRKAEADPSLIQIQIQIDECKKVVDNIQNKYNSSLKHSSEIETKMKNIQSELVVKINVISEVDYSLNSLCDKNTEAAMLGINKFNEQIKSKTPATIVQNFSPLKVGLENKKTEFGSELMKFQSKYNSKYSCDLGTDINQIQEYVNEHYKLVSSDIIKYDEELKKAKENCEQEFRESFLARLKENIENANLEFKNLNSALKDIYYGEDSYKFEITKSKRKESIYQMIMSKNNMEGFNLLSSSYNDEFKEEMEDLFGKLTAFDDKGEKVLAEYTDYRNYLDYDILVEKKDGTQQRFSKIYGEKSGGETQTPYYVAIAASFVQLYKHGDTIRIIMLDEAFDKMDDNRISSMMDFFNSQNFQIILATPPSKVEIIGEKVDTILMAMREGTTSIVEEYDL